MPNLAQPAFYRPFTPVRALNADQDRTVNLKNANGEVIDQISLIAGEWLVITADEHFIENSDANFKRNFDIVPGFKNTFTPKLPVQKLQQPLDGTEAKEFKQNFLRCTEKGLILCSPQLGLGQQATILSEQENSFDISQHMDVLKQERDQINRAPIYDANVQSDVHMFDLMSAQFDDKPKVARSDELESGIQPEDIEGIVADIMKAARKPYPKFFSMGAMPGADHKQIQSIREYLLGDMTEIPLERIQMTLYPHTEDTNPFEEFVNHIRETSEKRPLDYQPNLSNLMPGYTAEVERFARDGVVFLVVNDLMAQYVYTWPDRELAPNLRIK